MRELLERHRDLTGSERAAALLADWPARRCAASCASSRTTTAASSRPRRGCGPPGCPTEEAEMAAFEENARDLARVGGS